MVNNSSGTNTSGNLYQTSLTADGVLYADGSKVITSTAAGTAGQILQSAGAGVAPAYTTATFPATAGTTGTILTSNGTNIVNTTATYPATTTISQILYSSAANTVAGLATANSGVLATSSTGVPSINTNIAIGAGGQVTMASQPKFFAYLANAQTDVTGDGTLYVVPFDTEDFDVGSNFASNTFTAPVAGKYYFYAQVLAQQVVATMTANMIMVISGNNYTNGNWGTTVTGNMPQNVSAIVNMAANDTAAVKINYGSGTKVVDVYGGADRRTYFTGYLIG